MMDSRSTLYAAGGLPELFSLHEPCLSGIERIVWNRGCYSDHRCPPSDVVSTCDEAEEISGAETGRPGTGLMASIYSV